MPEENVKKMNFFKRAITSIKDFERYQDFAIEKTIVAINYLSILMLIFTIIISASSTYKLINSINKGVNYIKNNIYEMNYQNEKLSINNGEEIKFVNNKGTLQIIVINTSATEEQEKQYNNEITKYENGLILLNNKLIYRNAILNQNMEYTYKNIAQINNTTSLNKDEMLACIENMSTPKLYTIAFAITFIYMFLIYFTNVLVDAVMLAVLGIIFARIVGMKIKFKANFNMSIHALTLPIILNLIYIMLKMLLGFEIKYFQWLYTTISYIYMIVAILMIKADFINKQVELMKIVEEQEKVRKEIQEKEQAKKEEENKKKKDDKENKGKKDDKDKEDENDEIGNSGLAPQG